MADPVVAVEDLEDGEIESDGEDPTEVPKEDKKEKDAPNDNEKNLEEINMPQDYYHPRPGKKKKSKSNKGEQKFKERSKKNRKRPNQADFAESIEKAIRKAMNKNQCEEGDTCTKEDENTEERRKPKKRKRYDGRDGINKKRKKQEVTDEIDESEMMFVRGASPVQRQSPVDNMLHDDGGDSASNSSNESREQQQHHRQQQRQRPLQRERNKNNNKNDRRRGGGAHPMQDPDGVCLYFMQGKCHKGDDCIYSHDAHPPRKMELCKFYLMECCAKRDKCLYMHADFPCKYYHTGIPCIYKEECKFAHGKPLTDNLKNILLKHIESAPKEILGDFPRLNREGAMKMIQATQAKLMQQYCDNSDSQEKNIPSIFELNIQNPQNTDTLQINQFNNDRQNRHSPKIRHSRWQNENQNQNFNMNLSPGSNANSANVLSIKNLTGVLTPKQISDLTKMGIDNLDQLGQLTVLQLNSIGISLKQITEIQLNTMSIQKLGLISNNCEQPPQQYLPPATGAMDLDLRVPPPAVSLSKSIPSTAEFPGKDVDMRFINQPSVSLQVSEGSSSNKTIKKDLQSVKDMIDIDQYTKDALKFVSKDKENIDISNETVDNEKPAVSHEIKDVDHRVLSFVEDMPKSAATSEEKDNIKKGVDTDIRFLQPEPLFKNSEKRHRRSTTDDEDNNLLIDEKWYSSDEEKGYKKKSPASSPQQALLSPPVLAPRVIGPSSLISQLGDLSKIDISDEVTKLLNTMKSNMYENKIESTEASDPRKSRDPRSKKSPDKEKLETNKIPTKKPHRVSIYECIDGEPTDGRRRSDVDLRKPDYPAFGDTDLRQSTSGDIDLRLGLPFKAIPNYTPASEINGSINSHPPIPYKLIQIEIPRPDYTDIRNSTAKSQALVDPRLRKVFRLSLDESNSDTEKAIKSPVQSSAPRLDPRRKKEINESANLEKQNSLDIQTILQNSDWFKELSSTQKINVNKNLMPVTQMLKQFHQEKVQGKKIDLSFLQNNTVLCGVFTNLGITLNENGEYTYLPKPKEALLHTPINYNQQANPFGLNSNAMDGPNMNMISMPMSSMGMNAVGGMNNMNAGPMHGFNQSMSDPRGAPTPGLLGIAPNIPHNFNNFGPNNFGNNMYSDFNNFMDAEQNFQRFPNRGGHRGRGNERWNRGGGARGHRDNRKNYNDRGNWKKDRH